MRNATVIKVLVREILTQHYSKNQEAQGVINPTGDWTAVCYLTYESNGLKLKAYNYTQENTNIGVGN